MYNIFLCRFFFSYDMMGKGVIRGVDMKRGREWCDKIVSHTVFGSLKPIQTEILQILNCLIFSRLQSKTH